MAITWREYQTSVYGELQRLKYYLMYTDQVYVSAWIQGHESFNTLSHRRSSCRRDIM